MLNTVKRQDLATIDAVAKYEIALNREVIPSIARPLTVRTIFEKAPLYLRLNVSTMS